jgi:hypothetical protein
VAEELGLEQRLGDGGAVDGDERAVLARAERVKRSGKQLLAGAALSFEEHGGIGAGRAVQVLQHGAQRGIVADDARCAALLGQLLAQHHVLGEHAPVRQRSGHHQREVIGVHRLGQELHRPFLHGGHGVLDAAVGGHHHHLQIRVEFLGGAQHAEAVAVRELEIGEHHGGPRLAHLLDGLALVARFHHGVPLRFERKAQHRAQRVLVLDEEYGRRRHGRPKRGG